MISVLLWTLYLYVGNLQRVETVKIFKNLIVPEQKAYTRYQPTIASKTCLLIPDTGPCRSRISMWYFNSKDKECQTFEWGGCQGNGNRFDSKEACWDYCMTKPGKRRPRYCNLAFDYGFCFGASQRYYYDSKWQVCKSALYSGCGGNKNNFYSREMCDQICRFGNKGVSKRTSTTGGGKKVIIINPDSTTEKRTRIQSGNDSTTAAAILKYIG
ncbi:tissue factor pathway inhibitor-like [Spodoptera frugiperda]|uniref:Tissue factor pathway inhibitor-like n=1 Tax=Spodoptera frugiperda TaxID=7108 RepID=A0A9R0D5V3_SPOFR|nr:tissue factor pathway inhibitor-like [Spodoptera frugiperda]